MLMVMLSTNTATRERKLIDRIKENLIKKIFLFLTGFEPVTSGFFVELCPLSLSPYPLSYFDPLIYRYTIHSNMTKITS